jgi:hypothetical protein
MGAFGFIFHIQNQFADAKLKVRMKEIATEIKNTDAIQEYVTTCLDLAVQESIHLLASQGGVIYNNSDLNQSGKTLLGDEYEDYIHYNDTFFNNTGEERFVRYGLKRQSETSSCLASPYAPDYPYPKTSLTTIKSKYINLIKQGDTFENDHPCGVFDGPLGVLHTNFLCRTNGSNYKLDDLNELELSSQKACYDKYFFDANADISQITDEFPFSIQEDLESHISYLVNECANFSSLEDIHGYKIKSQHKPIIDLYYNFHKVNKYAGIAVNARFPLEISGNGIKKGHVMLDFLNDYDYPLSTVFRSIIFSILGGEARNPFYKLDTSGFLDVGIERSPKLWEGVPFVGYDYLVHIVLDDFTIGDRLVRWNFAIENRYPVLDYLFGSSSTASHHGDFDYVVQEGDELILYPEGLDPDDETVFYDYKGWRQNYSTFFNETYCYQQMGEVYTIDELQALCVFGKQNDLNSNGLNEVSQSFNLENIGEVYDLVDPESKKWKNSSEFHDSKQNASITTERKDIGLHKVRVITKDIYGQYDYQDVSILVFDTPTANLELENLFDDIDDSHASIEDVYMLDAMSSFSFTSNIVSYSYLDSLPGDITPVFHEMTDLGQLYIPNNITESDYETRTINNLVSAPYNEDGLVNYPIIHNVILSVVDQYGTQAAEPAEEEIQVYECLPHTNYDPSINDRENPRPGIYPYAKAMYGDSQLENYQKEHTCCYGWADDDNANPDDPNSGYGTIATGEPCYEVEFNMCHKDLIPVGFKEYDKLVGNFDNAMVGVPVAETGKDLEFETDELDIPVGNEWSSVGSQAVDKQKVYIATVTQKCGNRGNSCSGDFEVDITESDIDCTDQTDHDLFGGVNPSTPDRSCVGPVQDFNDCKAPVESCYEYDIGENYEHNLINVNLPEDCYSSHGYKSGISKLGYLEIGNDNYKCNTFFCDGSGECGYVKPEDCQCKDSEDICTGVDAGLLYMVNTNPNYNNIVPKSGYYCGNNLNYACSGVGTSSSGCVFTDKDNLLEACYCATASVVVTGDLADSDTAYDYFISFPGDGVTQKCCISDSNLYIDHLNVKSDDYDEICFGGVPKDEGIIDDSEKYLNYDGQLYECLANGVNTDPNKIPEAHAISESYLVNNGYGHCSSPGGAYKCDMINGIFVDGFVQNCPCSNSNHCVSNGENQCVKNSDVLGYNIFHCDDECPEGDQCKVGNSNGICSDDNQCLKSCDEQSDCSGSQRCIKDDSNNFVCTTDYIDEDICLDYQGYDGWMDSSVCRRSCLSSGDCGGYPFCVSVDGNEPYRCYNSCPEYRPCHRTDGPSTCEIDSVTNDEICPETGGGIS